jgi:prepilin-type N-terminal cleavage/methylation domain-containing protein
MGRRTRTRREGFSLIEIIVAMTILAVVLLSLSGLAAQAASRATNNDLLVKRAAAMQLEASKLGAMPYATLTSMSTADATFTNGGFTYTRRLTRTAGTNRQTVKLVIVPALDTTKKDSITFDRANPPSSTPLCVGC